MSSHISNVRPKYDKDGKTLAEVVVEYPIGHARRRKEGIPLLEAMPVNEYVDLYVI